jgi:hypothetical protein
MASEVLFQSYYCFASSYNQKIEVICNFVETDEGIRTLVIIDSSTQTNLITILNILTEDDQVPCYVRLVLGNPDVPLEVYEYNFNEGTCNKTIYVLPKLNNMATNLIKRLKPILAIFT